MRELTELYYFSPTGGTKKAGMLLCEGISWDVEAVDLGKKEEAPREPEGDLVVAAMPVFGGRIPGVAAEKLRTLNGKGKKAVAVAVYGNRAYEDALLELKDILEECGFEVTAAAALVAQHSMVPEVGAGRPDEEDQKEILEFGRKVREKLEKGSHGAVEIPGNRPYKDEMEIPATPMSAPSCTKCGRCAMACPTDAIRIEDGQVMTEKESCILCMACKAACPEHARILPPPMQAMMNEKLGAFRTVRGANELFLG